ncbi:alpha/beta hydrolase [Bordetella genomosp. 11]|uniref:Alpha/beta hydrolase n=1 Tax=Bordetella genomosp. 11 TaxID=1416808 RepID=A0A261UEV3_9BORD|nr:alpha/beta hydrolase [Bordetella genomosp. 11]OZI60469.1 alpha/beta hydrolase [Bordetella genomosp. 11]
MSTSGSTSFCYGGNVHANGIRQHYLRYAPGGAAQDGAGLGPDGRGGALDAVIIVPGITSPAATWGFVGERFGRVFDTYVLDVRGRGLSQAGAQLDYGLDAQADDVVAFAGALGLTRYSLVGHSMGGRIAIRAASRRPAGLARVVAVDPPVSGPGRRGYPAQLPWYVDSIAQASRGMDAGQMRAFCPTWTQEQLRLRAEWLHTCDERAIRQSFEEFHTQDIHANLPAMDVPLLLVTAARGDVVRDEDVAEIQAMKPGTTHVRVADAGHMIPWDNEEGFYAAFGDFLGARLPGEQSR